MKSLISIKYLYIKINRIKVLFLYILSSMNIVVTHNQFNNKCIYFNEPIQNTVMDNSKHKWLNICLYQNISCVTIINVTQLVL